MDRDRIGAALAVLQRELHAQELTPAVSVNVGRLYMRFKSTRPRGRAWRLVRSLLKPFVVAFWRAPCSEVTAEGYEAFRVRRRRQATRTGKPPKDTTVNLELSRARELMEFAVDVGAIGRNPLARVRKLKCRESRETWLTWDQFELLWGKADVLCQPEKRREDLFSGQRRVALFRALALALVQTGMRVGECIRLRRDRISITGVYRLGSEHTKTRRQRPLAFTARALAAFRDVEEIAGSPYVFASKRSRGLPYDLSSPRAWFRKVVEAAGLDSAVADGDFRLRIHDLRHSAASIADARGASATMIQAMLGHATLRTTARYLHQDREANAMAMARIMENTERRPPVRTFGEKNIDKSSAAVAKQFS